jgi:dimethylhistidine N-methyltransferase
MNTSTMAVACVEHGAGLAERYLRLRHNTAALVEALSPEDLVVQSMPDASPAKWHLAHTTWFFETFVLAPRDGYRPFDPQYGYLFNSYYEALGARQPRPDRGLMTRPGIDAIMAYRRHVDSHMEELLRGELADALGPLVALGIAHEEQHQELLQMDLLHLFSRSPLFPAFDPAWRAPAGGRRGRFVALAGGLVAQGGEGDGFMFDNEGPRHKVWLEAGEISDRLVTNGEWLAFIEAGGYRDPAWWLADGWAIVQAEGWQAPLYWHADAAGWRAMTPGGLQPLQPDQAVTHVSYYEAAAFAAWRGVRLPTEAEWEWAAVNAPLQQVADVAWQWTASPYTPYPGFRAAPDAVGEYNGKFMAQQMVLRGGASVTPPGHTRPTYRNFYRPEQRWMFSGVRLARDLPAHGLASPDHAAFAQDVRAGLAKKQKALSPKYFYDALGSDLFEAICVLPEYYPTRTETALLRDIAAELAAAIAPGAALIEFGSGASDKTRLLLDAAPQIAAYVPIDISVDALDKAAARLAPHYPALAVLPVAADFTDTLALPGRVRAMPRVGFFPGSTIGNFTRGEAVAFLQSVRLLLGAGATLIVGADMVKDAATLVAAYDDAAGVTARFNKNMLVRINRELHGDFDVDAFDHAARWNGALERIEMHLVSRADQIVNAAGASFAFKAGESIHTENSHKFTAASFAAMALDAGWRVERQWTSTAPAFSIFNLVAQGDIAA